MKQRTFAGKQARFGYKIQAAGRPGSGRQRCSVTGSCAAPGSGLLVDPNFPLSQAVAPDDVAQAIVLVLSEPGHVPIPRLMVPGCEPIQDSPVLVHASTFGHSSSRNALVYER